MKAVKYVLKTLSFISIILIGVIVTIFSIGIIFCYGPSKTAKNLFITTLLETGQLKFAAHLFMNNESIQRIVDNNRMTSFDEEIDDTMISTKNEGSNDIIIENVSGANFQGKIMLIKDPSRIRLATVYDGKWKEYGKTLDTLVNENDAIAGVNGGLYYSIGNKGGRPRGIVVRNSKIEYNNPVVGLHLIGLNENNLLKVIDLSEKSTAEIANIVKKEKIRDAVGFQEESSDANNHFVKLIINGKARISKGSGSGANPRTAIGQTKDGTILLLVTDGRGLNGHLGATAKDLIDIMEKYGAVNAANLDGGSSSSMYYKGKFEMTSTTLVHSNSSWRLPTAFIVMKR